ncbi:predicted protein [Thalassiosira pseudonana CCMP1335]|uniref:Right handed beta helix domain-containing protein n=1 Tax=Thalassiosira pseudonana TaxID=35128 RepID=B8C6I6_THAPS|nr:predicted protein [Thalassiosira pseudonana CCMP1335]EED90812.1 predicted protein [Thalassiosira pseudonana CCMP1335]
MLHKSRIRRRTSTINIRHRRRPNDVTLGNLSLVSILLLLATTTAVTAYLGPAPCTKPGTSAMNAIPSHSSSRGYSTFNHLLFDMVSISATFRHGGVIPAERLLFTICRGSVINLDDSSLPLGFLPVTVPRVTIQCGDTGARGTNSNNHNNDACIIRGGGKRDATSENWNTNPKASYKNSKAGIIGGGQQSVAQIYVYGESAFEVTLRGLTFDNSLTKEEMEMYTAFVGQFGVDALNDDGVGSGEGNGGSANSDGVSEGNGNGEDVEQELLLGSQKSDTLTGVNLNQDAQESTSTLDPWGGAEDLSSSDPRRTLQGINSSNIQPANRFASVAVRGAGYGDDAGPRIITIDDCKFDSHRGYAVLVSPGIQQPDMPSAPSFDFPDPTSGGSGGDGENAQTPSGQATTTTGPSKHNYGNTGGNMPNGQNRRLNLLDDSKFIPQGGLVNYYDNTASINYLDGRRVKITNTEFTNNVADGSKVAGFVTSAYSLTLSDCLFQKNTAKAMIFVYNNEALVKNSIFTENTVEVSTVILASPEGSSASVDGEPTHLVEQSCFLGSKVGISNILVTDVENTGFGQRDNHATGTEFTWVSTCEGGAAEKNGNDCLETGVCYGTCVQFTSEKCMADKKSSFSSSFGYVRFNSGVRVQRSAWLWAVSVGLGAALSIGPLI